MTNMTILSGLLKNACQAVSLIWVQKYKKMRFECNSGNGVKCLQHFGLMFHSGAVTSHYGMNLKSVVTFQ